MRRRGRNLGRQPAARLVPKLAREPQARGQGVDRRERSGVRGDAAPALRAHQPDTGRCREAPTMLLHRAICDVWQQTERYITVHCLVLSFTHSGKPHNGVLNSLRLYQRFTTISNFSRTLSCTRLSSTNPAVVKRHAPPHPNRRPPRKWWQTPTGRCLPSSCFPRG